MLKRSGAAPDPVGVPGGGGGSDCAPLAHCVPHADCAPLAVRAPLADRAQLVVLADQAPECTATGKTGRCAATGTNHGPSVFWQSKQ